MSLPTVESGSEISAIVPNVVPVCEKASDENWLGVVTSVGITIPPMR